MTLKEQGLQSALSACSPEYLLLNTELGTSGSYAWEKFIISTDFKGLTTSFQSVELPWCYCYLKCQYFKKKGSWEGRVHHPPLLHLPHQAKSSLLKSFACLHLLGSRQQVLRFNTLYTSSFKKKLLRWVNLKEQGLTPKRGEKPGHGDLSGNHRQLCRAGDSQGLKFRLVSEA